MWKSSNSTKCQGTEMKRLKAFENIEALKTKNIQKLVKRTFKETILKLQAFSRGDDEELHADGPTVEHFGV